MTTYSDLEKTILNQIFAFTNQKNNHLEFNIHN